MKLVDWELRFIQLINEAHPSWTQRCFRAFLWGASQLYALGARLRRWAYMRGIFTSYRLTIPVVSVGNLATGGTGKTPLVAYLTEKLSAHMQIAILTRGYRSPSENADLPVVVSKGEGPMVPAAQCGDEAYLLARLCPQAIVIAGSNRLKGGKRAVDLGAELILLDDGFQHLRLQRDLDIVTMDGDSPLGGGHCLPRGFLREGSRALSVADWIVITKGEEGLARKVVATTPFRGQVLAAHPKPALSKPSLQAKPIAAFCGIAQPSHFFEMLEQQGADLRHTWVLPDHVAPSPENINSFLKDAKSMGAEAVYCTSKDFVKLPSLAAPLLPIHEFSIQCQWKEDPSSLLRALRDLV